MSAFNAEGYWNKGRLFINRAMESPEIRSEDERRLWASLALEVLAKWALAATSPTLVADPAKGDGEQLYKALGIRDGGPYVSVTATTAFKRCAALYHPFDDRRATGYSNARNEYLHGADIDLLRFPAATWWSQFWSLISVLLAAHDREPQDLVGPAGAAEVEAHLARSEARVREQVQAAVAAAQRNLARWNAGTMTAPEARRWKQRGHGRLGSKYSADARCPACEATGTVETDYDDSREIIWPDGEYTDEPYVEVTFTPDYFSCPVCHLVLSDFDQLLEANLTDSITVDTDEEIDYEPDYGND